METLFSVSGMGYPVRGSSRWWYTVPFFWKLCSYQEDVAMPASWSCTVPNTEPVLSGSRIATFHGRVPPCASWCAPITNRFPP